MAKVDFDLSVSEFEHQSLSYVHFQTNTLKEDMKPLIPPALS